MSGSTERDVQFACPRCDAGLSGDYAAGFRCVGCKVDFPSVGGIPWLFAEPGAALGEWRGRLGFAVRQLEQQHAHLTNALTQPNLRDSTRRRIAALQEATADHAKRLRALLAPLEVDGLTASRETYLALRARLPPDQGLTTYYANVHRDWAWGGDENEASLGLVRDALDGRPLGRTLVLGAGAGRLAYDIHVQLAPTTTVALDFNPMLLLIAQRVARGEALQLYEFPIAPKSADEQAVLRTLTVDAPAAEGLLFVLADALRPPFMKGAFDTIVTPWLVDILPEPLDALAARVNYLLAEGGRWVNFGSLSFHDNNPVFRYTVEECIAVVADSGFEAPEFVEREMPYMASPASRHARQECVVAWGAAKTRSVKAPERYRALPEWLIRGNAPVPLSQSFQAQIMSTRIHAHIMSLIDGRRSLQDIAKILAEQKLMTAAEAEPALRSFLIRMFDDSRRQNLY